MILVLGEKDERKVIIVDEDKEIIVVVYKKLACFPKLSNFPPEHSDQNLRSKVRKIELEISHKNLKEKR